jgi:hypothetical protein
MGHLIPFLGHHRHLHGGANVFCLKVKPIVYRNLSALLASAHGTASSEDENASAATLAPGTANLSAHAHEHFQNVAKPTAEPLHKEGDAIFDRFTRLQARPTTEVEAHVLGCCPATAYAHRWEADEDRQQA